MKKSIFMRDALLAFFALAFALVFFLTGTRKNGASVVVICDGNVCGQHLLSESFCGEIRTPYGTNTLKIEGGAASVICADCPDGLCAAHAPISREGETIVCLPHRLVFEIRGQ